MRERRTKDRDPGPSVYSLIQLLYQLTSLSFTSSLGRCFAAIKHNLMLYIQVIDSLEKLSIYSDLYHLNTFIKQWKLSCRSFHS